MAFIAGQYTATYDGASTGQIASGITVNHSVFKELITGDNFADAPQDAVFRGMAVFTQYTLLEYNAAAARKCFWPYGSAYLTMDTVIGTLDVDLSGGNGNSLQVVLTAITGTPAQVAGAPATVTMPRAILAEGFPIDILFAPALRQIPIRQRIYPDASGVFGSLT